MYANEQERCTTVNTTGKKRQKEEEWERKWEERNAFAPGPILQALLYFLSYQTPEAFKAIFSPCMGIFYQGQQDGG